MDKDKTSGGYNSRTPQPTTALEKIETTSASTAGNSGMGGYSTRRTPSSQKSPNGKAPKTGDETDMIPWLTLLALSAVALRFVLFHKANKKSKE